MALGWLRRVAEKLRGWDVDLRAVRFYFSGNKGFHAELPATLFGGFRPSAELHRWLKRAAELIMAEIPFDGSIYDKLRSPDCPASAAMSPRAMRELATAADAARGQ